jgi:hypothetical protein
MAEGRMARLNGDSHPRQAVDSRQDADSASVTVGFVDDDPEKLEDLLPVSAGFRQ